MLSSCLQGLQTLKDRTREHEHVHCNHGRHDLSCTYPAHHEPESHFTNVTIVMAAGVPADGWDVRGSTVPSSTCSREWGMYSHTMNSLLPSMKSCIRHTHT